MYINICIYEQILSEEEITNFLIAAPLTDENLIIRNYLIIGLCCTMRRDELDKLEFNNVIDDGKKIIVNFYGSKTVGNKKLSFGYITDIQMVNCVRLYMSKFQYEVLIQFKY